MNSKNDRHRDFIVSAFQKTGSEVLARRLTHMHASWRQVSGYPRDLHTPHEAAQFIVDYTTPYLQNVPHPYESKKRSDISVAQYQPWLIDRIMPRNADEAPLMREDLREAVRCLAMFDVLRKRKQFGEHVKATMTDQGVKNPADLLHYRSYPMLRQALRPFQQHRSLSPQERIAADAFLDNEDAELLYVAPTWPERGLRLIKLNSRDAAMAYGKHSGWCTSHNKTSEWFEKYKEGLFYLEQPNGFRVQISFQHSQVHDANDDPVSLAACIKKTPELVSILTPHFMEGLVSRIKSGNDIDALLAEGSIFLKSLAQRKAASSFAPWVELRDQVLARQDRPLFIPVLTCMREFADQRSRPPEAPRAMQTMLAASLRAKDFPAILNILKHTFTTGWQDLVHPDFIYWSSRNAALRPDSKFAGEFYNVTEIGCWDDILHNPDYKPTLDSNFMPGENASPSRRKLHAPNSKLLSPGALMFLSRL